jgi:hypothetical protein
VRAAAATHIFDNVIVDMFARMLRFLLWSRPACAKLYSNTRGRRFRNWRFTFSFVTLACSPTITLSELDLSVILEIFILN